MKRRRSFVALQPFGVLLLVAGSLACSTLQSVIHAPGKVMRGIAGGGAADPPSVDAVTLRLMRFADLTAIRLTRATESFAAAAGTPEARLKALEWQIEYSRVFWRLAAGPQPYEGIFSSVVVATALRRAHERHWLQVWGEPDRVMLNALGKVEQDAWSLAEELTAPEHVEQARATIRRWAERDVESEASDVNALPAFGEVLAEEGGAESAVGLLGLITLDPLSGLEPAVAEVEQSRRLAERALYYLQHLPTLLSAQVELTALRSARTPELQGALAGWEQFSAASASIAATAEALPADFAAEREALLDQLSREIDAQRAGLLADLEAAREPLDEILRQAQGTAVAGRELSHEAAAAFEAGAEMSRAIEALIETSRKRPANDTRPPGRRFDITEYTAAAEGLDRAARAVTETISRLEGSLPQLQLAVREAVAQGDRTVELAFRRALVLLAVAIVGGAIAVLVVRRVTLRWRVGAGASGQG